MDVMTDVAKCKLGYNNTGNVSTSMNKTYQNTCVYLTKQTVHRMLDSLLESLVQMHCSAAVSFQYVAVNALFKFLTVV